MRWLLLVRHSLTEANERRLYYGWTDLPLSAAGETLAERARRLRPLPACERYYTSGLLRTDQTLRRLTGREPDAVLPDLREMRFGKFEMRCYEELREDEDYQRWIADDIWSGETPCPGGESQAQFSARVARGAAALLDDDWQSALAVIHGGVIANLMHRWFPEAPRNFFEWQPGPCGGWRVEFDAETPIGFRAIQEAT